MTVKDYAKEMNVKSNEVLKIAKEYDLNLNSENDILDDEAIILLDNEFSQPQSNAEEVTDETDKSAEVAVEKKQTSEKSNSVKRTKKTALKQNKKAFEKRKKEMYKNKEKLMKHEEVCESIIFYEDDMTVLQLAKALCVTNEELLDKLETVNVKLSLKDTVTFEIAKAITSSFNKTLKKEENRDLVKFEDFVIYDSDKDLVKRAPVVTVMGHVDHGKTSLLDYVRKENVTADEAGGITQAIGAYQAKFNDELITFIDTPGHAAFTEMRARGTSVTDIVIIIVAADDGVMPQTKEAIDHALAAEVPIIVAINKMDKQSANPDRVMEELAQYNITSEEWGGDIPFVKISAITGEGIDELLTTILAISEISNYKANPNRYSVGTVIESRLDKKVGRVATLLIQNGTLRLGDSVVAGTCHGKVRTLKDYQGLKIVSAGPSTPVEITGLCDNPNAGDKFMSFETDKEARDLASKREVVLKECNIADNPVSFDDLFAKINSGTKEINIILKADVKGSEEAIINSLEKLEVEDIKIKIIRSDIGTVTENDIILAEASNSIIIGFNVAPSNSVREMAKDKNIEIRLYQVIYKLIEEITDAMTGLLEPEYKEEVTGQAEVRRLFTFSKIGVIAGSFVTSGTIKNKSNARIIRDGIIVYDGVISSIQREKDQVKEVRKGFECGITIENFIDLKVKDIIETYEQVEIKR